MLPRKTYSAAEILRLIKQQQKQQQQQKPDLYSLSPAFCSPLLTRLASAVTGQPFLFKQQQQQRQQAQQQQREWLLYSSAASGARSCCLTA